MIYKIVACIKLSMLKQVLTMVCKTIFCLVLIYFYGGGVDKMYPNIVNVFSIESEHIE